MAVTLLNTRPAGQSEKLNEYLAEARIEVVNIPLVVLKPVLLSPDNIPVAEDYQGLFFSSFNGWKYFNEGLTNGAQKNWKKQSVYTLSKAVNNKLIDLNQPPVFCSGTASLSGFLNEYSSEKHVKWLHPCSSRTRLQSDKFKEKNIEVDNMPVYNPEIPAEAFSRLSNVYKGLDVILFTSGTGVQHFSQWCKLKNAGSIISALQGKKVVSFGPSVSEELEKEGYFAFKEVESTDVDEIVKLVNSKESLLH